MQLLFCPETGAGKPHNYLNHDICAAIWNEERVKIPKLARARCLLCVHGNLATCAPSVAHQRINKNKLFVIINKPNIKNKC